eukprot:g857.t1
MEDVTEDRKEIDDGTQEGPDDKVKQEGPDDEVKQEDPGAQKEKENAATNVEIEGMGPDERPSLKLSFGMAAPETRKRAATIDIIRHKKEAVSVEDRKRLARGELLIGLATILLFGIYLLRVLFFPTSDPVAFLVILPAIIATLGMRMLIKNNYSTAVLGLLFKQVNAILLMICVFCILVICVIELNFANLFFGVLYAIAATIFVLSDALDNISRRFIVLLELTSSFALEAYTENQEKVRWRYFIEIR